MASVHRDSQHKRKMERFQVIALCRARESLIWVGEDWMGFIQAIDHFMCLKVLRKLHVRSKSGVELLVSIQKTKR